MSVTEDQMQAGQLQIEPALLRAIIDSTAKGFELAGIQPSPVGASSLPVARHPMSVIVGVVGAQSGNVTMNFSESAVLHSAERFLHCEFKEICEDAFDAAMEIANIVAGVMKDALRETDFAIDHISLPSIIYGEKYSMVYARGITSVSVDFEIENMPFSSFNDRYFSTTVSLLPAAGRV